MGLQIVKEYEWGIYTWVDAEGRTVAADDGNGGVDILNIPAKEGDQKAMRKLAQFVKHDLGIEGGHPQFSPGQRRVTDEEFQEQSQRLKDGLVPDPLDFKAQRDGTV